MHPSFTNTVDIHTHNTSSVASGEWTWQPLSPTIQLDTQNDRIDGEEQALSETERVLLNDREEPQSQKESAVVAPWFQLLHVLSHEMENSRSRQLIPFILFIFYIFY